MDISAVIQDTGEVVSVGRSGLALPGRVTTVGLELPETLTFEQWQGIGESLKGVERSLMWWIGDWLRFGERRWGEMYSQALDATDKSYTTLAKAKWVSEQTEFCRRRQNLPWAHHAEVAGLQCEIADSILDEAEANNLSRNDVRKRVSQYKAASKLLSLPHSNDTCSASDLFRLADSGTKFGAIESIQMWSRWALAHPRFR